MDEEGGRTELDEEDDLLREQHERQPEKHILLPHLGQGPAQDATDVVLNPQSLHICSSGREGTGTKAGGSVRARRRSPVWEGRPPAGRRGQELKGGAHL